MVTPFGSVESISSVMVIAIAVVTIVILDAMLLNV